MDSLSFHLVQIVPVTSIWRPILVYYLFSPGGDRRIGPDIDDLKIMRGIEAGEHVDFVSSPGTAQNRMAEFGKFIHHCPAETPCYTRDNNNKRLGFDGIHERGVSILLRAIIMQEPTCDTSCLAWHSGLK